MKTQSCLGLQSSNVIGIVTKTSQNFLFEIKLRGVEFRGFAYQNSKSLRWVGKVGEKHYPMKGGFVFGKPRFGSATNGLTTQMNTIIEIISTSLHLAVHGRGQGNPRPHDLERSFKVAQLLSHSGIVSFCHTSFQPPKLGFSRNTDTFPNKQNKPLETLVSLGTQLSMRG